MPKKTAKKQTKKRSTKPAKKPVALLAPPRPTWRQRIQQPAFAKYYLLACLLILTATTVFWALLSAHLQAGNADQPANAFLFEHRATLHGASLPGQHTFLFKWPLFLLARAFGYSTRAFVGLTVATVLVTVGGFVTLLGSIERRPLALGTLCLGLASTLLLVPAMPYSGGILPVNMAMLTTRNLEYLVYLASLVLLLKAHHLRSWQFVISALLMALLVASDKLFWTLGLGAALLALLAYALVQGWQLVSLGARWAVHSLLALVTAIGVLALLDRLHVIHVLNGAGGGPYGLIHNAHSLALGSIYAGLGLLTNFGANPAFDATRLHDLRPLATHRLLSLGGPAFVVNLVIALAALWVAWRLLKNSLEHRRDREVPMHQPHTLAVMLLWSTVAAVGAFVMTDHYYAVDARYLAIGLFAAFVCFAAYSQSRQWSPSRLVITGIVLVISMLLGIRTVLATYHSQSAALNSNSDRNNLVAQVLSQHPVDMLVGDYWRVLPTKLQVPRLTVLPLDSCTQLRTALSSTAWQLDLTKHSFAYLLSLDQGLTDYPSCSLAEITAAYGRPNSSALIAGSFAHPQEQLLFYDQGAQRGLPTDQPKASLIDPLPLDELPTPMCNGPTAMNIVAHQDDDLLFMNPDLLHDIQAKRCERTVYITAGDAGNGPFYWLGREHGSEAAYDVMAGRLKEVWLERTIKLNNTAYITVATPHVNPRLSLIFFHLPDGNLDGSGFKAAHSESLQKLEAGAIPAIHSVDGQSSYNKDQLVGALVSLMEIYQPSLVRSQADDPGHQFGDHSDHLTVGRLVKAAYDRYETEHYENQLVIPLSFYMGYPIREFPPNISGAELDQKEAAFFAYSRFDTGVCGSVPQCSAGPAYGDYLPRQYQQPE